MDHRLSAMISTVSWLGIAVHLLLIPFFLWLGIAWLAALNVVSTAIWVSGWALNRKGNQPLAVTLMAAEVTIHTLLATMVLGFAAGFQYYLFGCIPFILFNTQWRDRQIVATSVLLMALFVVLFLTVPLLNYEFPAAWVVSALHVVNAVIAFIGVGLTSYYFRVASLSAEEELRARASTDSLTELHNRRKLTDLLEGFRMKARQTGRPYSLILADIDFFKRFNDDHGHECGDFALKHVARLLEEEARTRDALGRWGGEEFLIILPETTGLQAAEIAEHLRHVVEASELLYEGRRLHVTMTLGVAEGKGSESIDAVLARADTALYRGKREGRNRVDVAMAVA